MKIFNLRPRSSDCLRKTFSWLLIGSYLSLVVAFAWKPTQFAQLLAAIGIVTAFGHAVLTYRWKNALTLLVICLTVTFAMENIGTPTGVPFGKYHFEVGASFPHVGYIPLIVGPLWFGMGYFAWNVAATLLDDADRQLNKAFNLFALPIVAAMTMTQWDLVMDPSNSTIFKAWIWHEGGSYFGVPLSNYFGWLLTSWLFYQAFAFYLRSYAEVSTPTRSENLRLRLAAILFYASSGLTYLIPSLIGEQNQITDAAGNVWRERDLRETTALVMLFTMLFTSALAISRLIKNGGSLDKLP